MAQVISATDTFKRAGRTGKRVHFLSQAHGLLKEARQEAALNRPDQALEFAYQAALRTAGAWVADSAVSRRKRPPASVWDRLNLVGGAATAWVETFRPYSRLRSRLNSGLEDAATLDQALELIAVVARFLQAAEDKDFLLEAA